MENTGDKESGIDRDVIINNKIYYMIFVLGCLPEVFEKKDIEFFERRDRNLYYIKASGGILGLMTSMSFYKNKFFTYPISKKLFSVLITLLSVDVSSRVFEIAADSILYSKNLKELALKYNFDDDEIKDFIELNKGATESTGNIISEINSNHLSALKIEQSKNENNFNDKI